MRWPYLTVSMCIDKLNDVDLIIPVCRRALSWDVPDNLKTLLGSMKCFLQQVEKFLIGSGVGEVGEGISNAAVVPFDVFHTFGGVEAAP